MINIRVMRRLRQFHLYLGIFFAPAILFFAFSGALQTFDFHETERGIAPPRWIAVIAAVHKKQNFPKPKPPKLAQRQIGEAVKPVTPVTPSIGPRHSPFPLKVFVGFMSVGLMLSALLGIVIALNNKTIRRGSIFMLVIGTVVPVALLLL